MDGHLILNPATFRIRRVSANHSIAMLKDRDVRYITPCALFRNHKLYRLSASTAPVF